jgi:hypothetical protein
MMRDISQRVDRPGVARKGGLIACLQLFQRDFILWDYREKDRRLSISIQ